MLATAVSWQQLAEKRRLLVKDIRRPHYSLGLRSGEIRVPMDPRKIIELISLVRAHGRKHGHEDHREMIELVSDARLMPLTRRWWTPDLPANGPRVDLGHWLRRQGHDVEQLR